MADIKGITIQLDADTMPLEKGLRELNKVTKDIDKELKEVRAGLKFDPKNVELLTQKQTLLTQKIEETKKKVDALKDAQKQAAQQLANGEIGEEEYRKLSREVEKAESQLNTFGDQLKETNAQLKDAQKPLQEASEKLGDIGEKSKQAADKMAPISTAAGVAAGAAVGLAVSLGDQLTGALRDLQSQTGATEEEMAELETIMRDMYTAGWGESYDDLADAMAAVQQATGFMGDELQEATENALMLRDTFDWEVPEQIRAVNQLMKYFGVTSDEAFNLLAQGAQSGLDQNDNLLDTINEYAPAFEEMGFSSEEMFNALKSGADAGVFDIDKLGDAINEFSIRATDGSDSTRQAFEDLGLNADEMQDKFLQGGDTAQEAFQQVVDALANTEDPMLQNQAGIALFGTMWEDTGAKAMLALGDTQGEITKTSDALANIDASSVETLGEKFEILKRTLIEELLPPLQEALMPILDAVITKAQEWGEKLGEVDPKVILVITAIAGLVAAIAPLLALFGMISTGISALLPVIGLLISPWGLIAAAVVAAVVLITSNWDSLKAGAIELKDTVVEKWNALKEGISQAGENIKTAVSDAWENGRMF